MQEDREVLRALKRAVAFHRSGEIRDRSFEAQSHRASGLNLVTLISTWNTVDLERAVRVQGQEVPDGVLAHLSPLTWEHIGLTGDSAWRPEHVPAPGEYRRLRP